MNWWADHVLWHNTKVQLRVRTRVERLQRVRNSLLSKTYTNGCEIYHVDFEGEHDVKALPPPRTT